MNPNRSGLPAGARKNSFASLFGQDGLILNIISVMLTSHLINNPYIRSKIG